MSTRFIWLLDATFPRRGPQLETGKEYDVSAFSAGAVSEWVKSGAAKWADAPKKSGKKAGEQEE